MVRNLGELGITMQKIISRLTANQNLLKLLYYTDKDPLSQPDLTDEQIANKVMNQLIKVIPRLGAKEDSTSVVSLRVVAGSPDKSNDEYINLIFAIEVFVPMTQWFIKNTNLRPFCIMGEIQNSLNDKNINGIGKLKGGDFHINFLTEEMCSYEMNFALVAYD